MTNQVITKHHLQKTHHIHHLKHFVKQHQTSDFSATSEAPGFLGPGARGPEPHCSRPLNRPCPRWPLCRWTRWQQRPGRCSESAQHLSVLRYLRVLDCMGVYMLLFDGLNLFKDGLN